MSTGPPTTGAPSTGDPSTGDPTTGALPTGDPSAGAPSAGDPATGDPTALGTTVRERVRRSRGPLAIALVVLLGAVVLTAIGLGTEQGLLEPDGVGPQGSGALAAVLREQGVTIDVATRPEQVADAGPDATVLVAFPDLLGATGRAAVAASGADVVLVTPGAPVLTDLAPGVEPAPVPPALLTTGPAPGPGCAVPAAVAAGTVDLVGAVYEITPPAVGCYVVEGVAPLAVSGRTTVVGDATPFTNDALADVGNAALTMRLLGAQPRLVWYLPEPLPGDDPETPLVELVPAGWLWGAVQLLVAGGLLALWRGRRLGPLVPERLPVRVSAAETTRGRAALYRRLGARGRAAEVLRARTRRRLAARLGLPATVPTDVLAAAVAAASPSRPTDAAHPTDPGAVGTLLAGDAPPDDRALVALAGRLDALEAAVRAPDPVPGRDTGHHPTEGAS